MHTLRPSQSQIIEHFVRNRINGIVLDSMNEKAFMESWHTSLKIKHKSSFVQLYHAIKQCQIQDIVNLSGRGSLQNEGVFMKWNKRTNFTFIKRVGYRWDDGVITIADVISHSSENRIQISVRNIESKENAYLTEPFWVTLPNDKLCKPTKEAIEQSHYDVFNKWMMMLRIKHQQNSDFEDNVFRDMASVSRLHVQLLFTIKYANYSVKLEDKTYEHVLQSAFASALLSKCQKKRCNGRPKLNCHCDPKLYQTYTYYMIMTILSEMDKATDHTDQMLAILQTRNCNVEKTAHAMCAFLRIPPQYTTPNYLEKYRQYIHHWLLHDFYNTICSHCGSVNKSIMINRVFHYSLTLQHCRTCGEIASSHESKTSSAPLVYNKSKSIHWFCNTAHKRRVFEEEGIRMRALEKALNDCKWNNNISKKHEQSDLLDLLVSLLNEPFNELVYYLSRFLDDLRVLRIKITADFYFYGYPERFVSIDRFMCDAGIRSCHANVFKDCWSRAFASTKDNRPLIDILQLNAHPNVDVLCVNFELLQIFKKLTPSISTFTTQFIHKLKEYSPKINSNVDLFGLVMTFLDFKMDHNVFPVIDDELELVSLLWNRWEYLNPPISITATTEPMYDSLRSELRNELEETVHDIEQRYLNLQQKAQHAWTRLFGSSMSSKARKTGIKYFHAVLLFTQIGELRHNIRTLLPKVPLTEVHRRFGHLFMLLNEAVRIFGAVLDAKKSMFYCMDEEILLDKYRAKMNVPIIGSNTPIAFNNTSNQIMAECKSDPRGAALCAFNITSLLYPDGDAMDQDFYIFFGGACVIRPEIHIDRQRLESGSKCRIFSRSQHKWSSGQIARVFADGEGEWLEVHYGNKTSSKDVRRWSEDLSVTMFDAWDDLLVHFRGDIDMESIKASTDPLLELLVGILKEYEINCHAELMFRIKTVFTYYKKTLNIIPDFDVFIKETKIINEMTNDNLCGFRKRYKEEIFIKIQDANRSTLELRSENTLTDTLYDVGLFVRYEVNNPRFESLAEETMFNEVVNISNEQFNQHLIKAQQVYSERCFSMLATEDDFNFGIEKYQPISIAHIIAVIIHTKEPHYTRAFTRSCLLLNRTDSDMVIQHHCKNFYWFGRYLFECIEYFGKTLEQSSTQHP
eukprot:761818_1